MVKARRLGHIVMNVRDLEASRDFYCKALGLEVISENKPGRIVFLSGQLAWDKDGNTVGKGDMPAQLRQVGENLKDALEQAGGMLSDIVKITTFVTDMDQFFNCIDVREEYFGPGWPTSTTVEVSRLAHPDMLIEVEAIAVIGG